MKHTVYYETETSNIPMGHNVHVFQTMNDEDLCAFEWNTTTTKLNVSFGFENDTLEPWTAPDELVILYFL